MAHDGRSRRIQDKSGRSAPNFLNCDVPSRPWRQSRIDGKSPFYHHLQQRILTSAERRLRYPRIERDSRRRTRLIHLISSSHRVPFGSMAPAASLRRRNRTQKCSPASVSCLPPSHCPSRYSSSASARRRCCGPRTRKSPPTRAGAPPPNRCWRSRASRRSRCSRCCGSNRNRRHKSASSLSRPQFRPAAELAAWAGLLAELKVSGP